MRVTRSAAFWLANRYEAVMGVECLEMPAPSCCSRARPAKTRRRTGSAAATHSPAAPNAATSGASCEAATSHNVCGSDIGRAVWRSRRNAGGPKMAAAKNKIMATNRRRFMRNTRSCFC